MAVDPTSVPNFDDLPKVEGQPQGYAWGIFDKDGKKDVYGTLNFLTPKIITEAAAEVKEGVSISLNWPLNAIKFPLPGRAQPTHRCKTLRSSGMDMGGFDDELEFNTQFSSQWDSLCHVTQDPTGLAYNGFKPTVELLSCQHTAGNELPTIDHWHARGCIVGRGVLIDFKRYAEEVLGDAEYHPISPSCRITVEQLEDVAKWEGVEFKPGDILIVRTGYTEILESPTAADFAKMASGAIGGVKADLETVKWIWNKKFSAVAGDAHAFEALPPRKDDGPLTGLQELVLHPYLLTGFGMPIGELWDLKALSEYTKKTGKYSFMLTSAPLNHPGLVASPPNAVAIF